MWVTPDLPMPVATASSPVRSLALAMTPTKRQASSPLASIFALRMLDLQAVHEAMCGLAEAHIDKQNVNR